MNDINVENLFNIPECDGYLTFDATQYEPSLIGIDQDYYTHAKILDTEILDMNTMKHELNLLGEGQIVRGFKISMSRISSHAMNYARVPSLSNCPEYCKIEEIYNDTRCQLYWAAWNILIDDADFKAELEDLKKKVAKRCVEDYK